MKAIISLLRPRQWVKNGFVFAPLIFSGEVGNVDSLLKVSIAALLFCVASSATYVLNDIIDIEYDKLHPVKSKVKPLAAGALSKSYAFSMLFLLYTILIAGWFLSREVTIVICAYLTLNIAYSLYLKHQPVVDIFTIAAGFVLRVYSGAVALNLTVSSWMFITTLCLSLYLAALKRRQEIINTGADGRRVLKLYPLALIQRYAEISATGSLFFYSIFVMSSRPELVITIPLVLFGLFRYWFVVEVLDSGESPTDALLNDRQLLLTAVLWVAVCAYIIFMGRF